MARPDPWPDGQGPATSSVIGISVDQFTASWLRNWAVSAVNCGDNISPGRMVASSGNGEILREPVGFSVKRNGCNIIYIYIYMCVIMYV
jgi:hypothetical protein